jgi:hypothetical protein
VEDSVFNRIRECYIVGKFDSGRIGGPAGIFLNFSTICSKRVDNQVIMIYNVRRPKFRRNLNGCEFGTDEQKVDTGFE